MDMLPHDRGGRMERGPLVWADLVEWCHARQRVPLQGELLESQLLLAKALGVPAAEIIGNSVGDLDSIYPIPSEEHSKGADDLRSGFQVSSYCSLDRLCQGPGWQLANHEHAAHAVDLQWRGELAAGRAPRRKAGLVSHRNAASGTRPPNKE
jgi:hypothetical protein